MLIDPGPSYDQPRTQPYKGTRPGNEYGPARDIKQFTQPTIQLRGTAEEIGIDGRALADELEKKFVQDFAFLQNGFAFEKTYETWEIGLFGCTVWTVGNHYPIAFHIQCAGGSMDEPRHWQYATLGYGHRDKILDMVKHTLDAIVEEYATFIRKAGDKSERAGKEP